MVNLTARGVHEPHSFSHGIDSLLDHIRPYGRPETAFPDGFSVTDSRRASGESLHAWFAKVVDRYCRQDPTRIAVENNVAIVAKLRWQNDRLIYASASTLVTKPALEEYYLDGNAGAVCLRLDLNYETLGEPFSHPLVHVHVGDEGGPRFALDGGLSGNVIMDFLEFVYRNFQHEKWLRWARRCWLAEEADDDRVNQFNRIVEAFRDSQFHVLGDNARVVSQVKRTLRDAKDSLFKSHMNGADREIMEYPMAR